MIGQLAARYPDTWGKVPKAIGNKGSSGLYATGALCGNPLGCFLLFNMLGLPDVYAHNFARWFENTYLPTNQAYVDYRSGTWPEPTGGWGSKAPLNNAPKVRPQTMTCHGAHARWKVASGAWIQLHGADKANHDRCRKSTYASVYYMCELINKAKAGESVTVSWDPSVASCKTANCHGTDSTKLTGYPVSGVGGTMKCQPCHMTTAGITDGHGY